MLWRVLRHSQGSDGRSLGRATLLQPLSTSNRTLLATSSTVRRLAQELPIQRSPLSCLLGRLRPSDNRGRPFRSLLILTTAWTS